MGNMKMYSIKLAIGILLFFNITKQMNQSDLGKKRYETQMYKIRKYKNKAKLLEHYNTAL